MTIHIKDSGTWKEVYPIYVNDSGTWKEVQNGYIKDSGTWKEFFVNIRNLTYTFSSNTADATLDVTSLPDYVAGRSNIVITINSGVYVYATSTSNAGLTLTGGTAGDTITLINNGYIVGKGGNGSYNPSTYSSGYPGGTALSLGFNTTVNNTNSSAYIGGGGGGAGENGAPGGGGAGGGIGGLNTSAAASPGSVGADGDANTSAGGNGGMIFPGTGGAGAASFLSSSTDWEGHPGFGGGAGGGGGAESGWYASGYDAEAYGSPGGSSNNVGTNAPPNRSKARGGAGGGGWGASGGTGSDPIYSIGGAGGKAVALNGHSVTWVSGDTARVWGSVA